MAQLRRFLWRLRNVLRPFDAEPDLAREVNAHLRLMEDDFERQGLTPEQAMAAARRKFGGVEQAKELHRDARSWVWLDNLRRDAGYAWRTLRRTPGFTALAVLTLALGIAINTAVISVCDAVLLHPLPYPDAERLVVLRSVHTSPTPDSGLVSSLDLVDWQTRNRSFEAIAGYGWRTVDMTGGTHSERLFGLAKSETDASLRSERRPNGAISKSRRKFRCSRRSNSSRKVAAPKPHSGAWPHPGTGRNRSTSSRSGVGQKRAAFGCHPCRTS